MIWSYKYNCSHLQLEIENREWQWMDSPHHIENAVAVLYPNTPPNHGLKKFFYQCFGWYWSETERRLMRGTPPVDEMVNAIGEPGRGGEEDNDDFPLGHELLDVHGEIFKEQEYHRATLQKKGLIALLERYSPELIAYLNGQRRPGRPVTQINPNGIAQRTRAAQRRFQNLPPQPRLLPPRPLQPGEGPSNAVDTLPTPQELDEAPWIREEILNAHKARFPTLVPNEGLSDSD